MHLGCNEIKNHYQPHTARFMLYKETVDGMLWMNNSKLQMILLFTGHSGLVWISILQEKTKPANYCAIAILYEWLKTFDTDTNVYDNI